LIIGFLFLPFNTCSFLGVSALHWDELLPSLKNGFLCLLSINTVAQNCLSDTSSSNESTLPLCDHCEGSALTVSFYLVCNITNSVLTVLVIKHGSASIMYLVSTLRLPLLQLLFSCSFIQNPPDAFGKWDVAGFIVVCLGLIMYRWNKLPFFHHHPRSSALDYDDQWTIMPHYHDANGEVVTFGGGISGAGGMDVTSLGLRTGIIIGSVIGIVVGVAVGMIIAWL
jgi:hypothetical protein